MKTYIDSSVIVDILCQPKNGILSLTKLSKNTTDKNKLKANSDNIIAILQESNYLTTSIMSFYEMMQLFNQQVQNNDINEKTYQALKNNLSEFCQDIEIIQNNNQIFQQSIEIMERFYTKTDNAIHIASAIECHCDFFLSLDKQQNTLAKYFQISILNIEE